MVSHSGPLAFAAGVLLLNGSVALAQMMSTYGTPGLVEVPTAEMLPDSEIALTVSQFNNTRRQSLTYQILPRLNATFRYTLIDDWGPQRINNADRSFDVNFLLAPETYRRPGLVVGLRDIAGTGIYSSEYFVATKTVRPGLRFSGGVGWGRLGGRSGVTNPLGVLDARFKTRPSRSAVGASTGGTVDASAWFRGDMGFFGGVSWDITDHITLNAEYSPDLYAEEAIQGTEFIDDPWNVSLTYGFDNGVALTGFVIGQQEIGVQLGYRFNPKTPPMAGGREAAAPALLPAANVAAQSWNLPETQNRTQRRVVLAARLSDQGLRLDGYSISDDTAVVRVENHRWGNEAQAAGRAARVMANTLSPDIRHFDVVFQSDGVPISRVSIARQDLYELEHDVDGSWRSFARADISDAARVTEPAIAEDVFPRFNAQLIPFLQFSFFDPDEPLRYEFGPELVLGYNLAPGLKLSSNIRYPIFATIGDTRRGSNSVLPRVRTETFRYAQESDIQLNRLTTSYLFRPGEDLFGRVTGGYLETMFGGVSGELLWHPINSRLALGAEVNYAKQRDFDVLFGFKNYDVVTGHASAYIEFDSGFLVQVDAGRYLAKDWGGTFTLTREFDNGFRIGGFFTLTDVPFSEFGEGSFDKGISIDIPVAWFTGQPSRNKISQTVRPLTRDGGARLNVADRLYTVSRDYRSQSFEDGWGKFFR